MPSQTRAVRGGTWPTAPRRWCKCPHTLVVRARERCEHRDDRDGARQSKQGDTLGMSWLAGAEVVGHTHLRGTAVTPEERPEYSPHPGDHRIGCDRLGSELCSHERYERVCEVGREAVARDWASDRGERAQSAQRELRSPPPAPRASVVALVGAAVGDERTAGTRTRALSRAASR